MGNSSKPGGGGGEVLLASDLISDHKMSFSTPVFRPGGGQRNITCLHKTAVIIAEIRTSTKRFLKIHFEFAYYTCLLIHLDLKLYTNTFMQNRSSLDHTRFQTKIGKMCTRFQTKMA